MATIVITQSSIQLPVMDQLTQIAEVVEDDALLWPRSKKWVVTAALSASGFNRIMVGPHVFVSCFGQTFLKELT